MIYLHILSVCSLVGLSLASLVTWEACGGDTGGFCYYLGRCVNGTVCQCMNGWTGTNCVTPIDCGDISEKLDNVILPPSYYSNYGSVVSYTCKQHTQFPDVDDEGGRYHKGLRCNEDGNWGPDAMNCVALCPPLPVWEGYTIERAGHSRLEGGGVSYNCKGYYKNYQDYGKWLDAETYFVFEDEANETKTATCGADGQWDPPITRCISVEQLEEETADAGKLIPSAILLFLVTVICL